MDSIKKGTKLSVQLQALRFDEAICDVNITVMIQAHQVMATDISRNIWTILRLCFIIFLYL